MSRISVCVAWLLGHHNYKSMFPLVCVIHFVDVFLLLLFFFASQSVHVKYKIFLSAMEYLPFSAGDDSKGSFEEIIERYLYPFFCDFDFEVVCNFYVI